MTLLNLEVVSFPGKYTYDTPTQIASCKALRYKNREEFMCCLYLKDDECPVLKTKKLVIKEMCSWLPPWMVGDTACLQKYCSQEHILWQCILS